MEARLPSRVRLSIFGAAASGVGSTGAERLGDSSAPAVSGLVGDDSWVVPSADSGRASNPSAVRMSAADSVLDVITKPSVSMRSEEHTSELQSLAYLVCRLLLEKKKKATTHPLTRHRPHT